jgi:hypothetical protein
LGWRDGLHNAFSGALIAQTGDEMDWNRDAIDAAQTALKTVNEAIDAITMRATQLESLFALLAIASADAPFNHVNNVCLLGADLATEISAAAARLL